MYDYNDQQTPGPQEGLNFQQQPHLQDPPQIDNYNAQQTPGPQEGLNFQKKPHLQDPPQIDNYNAKHAPAPQPYQLPPGFAVNK